MDLLPSQMWTSVLVPCQDMAVVRMPSVSTLKVASTVPVMKDSQGMDLNALVRMLLCFLA